MNTLKLSVVTTLYRSSAYIEQFVDRTIKAILPLTTEYEIVLVNDGSPDNSLDVAILLSQKNGRIKIVDLTRNFGHHKAMIAGLQHATGETIFLIDCDLEEAPELAGEFWREFQNSPRIDLLYGVQRTNRKGGWFERVTGTLFHNAFQLLADDGIAQKNICTARMMTKAYVKALLQFDERDFYFGPVCTLAGFNQKSLAVDKTSKGMTSYTFLMKYHLFLNCILAFSQKPLYAIFYVGLLVTCLAAATTMYVFSQKVLFGTALEGWTSLFIAVCFFGGLNIFFIGLVALYISKILIEVKRRPLYLVKDVYESKGAVADLVNTDEILQRSTGSI
jgi:putative glycosyltransferase